LTKHEGAIYKQPQRTLREQYQSSVVGQYTQCLCHSDA